MVHRSPELKLFRLKCYCYLSSCVLRPVIASHGSLKVMLYKYLMIDIAPASNKFNRTRCFSTGLSSVTMAQQQVIIGSTACVCWYLHNWPLRLLPCAMVKKTPFNNTRQYDVSLRLRDLSIARIACWSGSNHPDQNTSQSPFCIGGGGGGGGGRRRES